MKNKKALLVLGSCLCVFVVVFSLCFLLLPKMTSVNSNQMANFSYGKNESSENNSNNENTSNKVNENNSELDYYINSQNSLKTMELFGETKIFKLTFSLFVSNCSNLSKKIMIAGFKINYEISEKGTFLSCECANQDGYITLASDEITELKFEVKYVISSSEFDSMQTYNLEIEYFGNKVYEIEL